jgi:serine/threonine protein kinase
VLAILKAARIKSSSVRKKRRIAGGHFGEVWLGKWEGIKVAIKTAKGTSRDVVEALLREVEVAKSIPPHPNIVRVYGVCDAADGGELQLLMEYCDGGGLLDWLEKRTDHKVRASCSLSADGVSVFLPVFRYKPGWPLSPPLDVVQVTVREALDVLTQVGRGLRHLHNSGVLHRDLAARNVLIKSGVFMVADFGLSSVVMDADTARMTSTVIGPVAWRAPETFHIDEHGRQIASVATDVYMLGGLMFEVLTAGQRAPFFWMPQERLIMMRATSSMNTLDAAMAAGVAIPWSVVVDEAWTGARDVVEQLRHLMAGCLNSEPSRRPTVDVFLSTLAAMKSGPSELQSPRVRVVDSGYAVVTAVTNSAAAAAAATAAATTSTPLDSTAVVPAVSVPVIGVGAGAGSVAASESSLPVKAVQNRALFAVSDVAATAMRPSSSLSATDQLFDVCFR